MEIKVTDMKIGRNADKKIDNGGIVARSTLLVNNMFLVNDVNLVSGKNGLCVLMPSLKRENGDFQDFALFNSKEERDKVTVLIMKEYMNRISILNEPYTKGMEVNLFIDERGKQKAYATVVIEGKMRINRIRVMEGENGLYVSMPKKKDAWGNYHEVVSMPTPEAYRALNELVLHEYFRQYKLKKTA